MISSFLESVWMKAPFCLKRLLQLKLLPQSPYHWMPVRSYLLTLVIVGLTTLLRMGLNPFLGRRAAFIVYFPALVFSAWLGGWGSGLFALVLSTLAAVYFFIAPMHGLQITNTVDQITLVIFFLVGLSVSALSASQRKARGEAEKSRLYAEAALLQAEIAAQDAQSSEQALQASEQRLRMALEGGGIATWTYDLTLDRVVADASLARLFSVSSEDAAGGRLEAYLKAIHPDDRSRVAQAIADAVAHQDVYEAEYRVVLPDGSNRWLATRGRVVRDALGLAVSLPGVVLDITEQVTRTERERFLANLAQRTQTLTDPDEVITDAVRSVGEFLGVSRCIFADIDIEADTCTIHPSEYRADPSSASIVGVVSIASFGAFVVSEYAARRAVSVDDVRLDSLRAPDGSLAAYEAINIRAHVTVPVVHFDRVVSCMSVHNAEPRHWKQEEIELLRAVVERTWLTVEVIRQNRALVREGEATARILASITDAFFALDEQFRFTFVNPQAERLLLRNRESPLGQEIWTAFPEGTDSTFDQQFRRALAEGIPVSFEAFYPSLDTWFEVRAYPSPDGGLSVFFQNVNERKALDAERERLAERERNIATQLQDALQPALPEHIPGLAVVSFTQPALQEAQVGGDFFDIFPLDKELYALVIGDVSGKGLAAAQQLALIRNSLRTTLYLYRSPAQAATNLNAILTAHDLLVGFVTTFVGVYDAATGRVAYVSCGHEPGLIRRVSGQVEKMETTGPPLGIDQNADYGESTITLSAGDLLLLYTDGISEVGPNRRELLGTDGLMQMVAKMTAGSSIAAQAEALVAEVSRYAGGVFRDDVAVLLAERL